MHRGFGISVCICCIFLKHRQSAAWCQLATPEQILLRICLGISHREYCCAGFGSCIGKGLRSISLCFHMFTLEVVVFVFDGPTAGTKAFLWVVIVVYISACPLVRCLVLGILFGLWSPVQPHGQQ